MFFMGSQLPEAQSVQVIDRTFAVLESVSSNGAMSLKDIYSATSLNKASTLRIVNALVANGYLDRDNNGNYFLTFKTYEVGLRALRRVDYITFIRETLGKLSDELEVIAQFSVREQNELLCLESFDSTRSNFSVYTRVGMRSQLYATSAGKAIISTYNDEDIRALWPEMNVRAFTPNTFTDFDEFMKEIYAIRARGYALDMEESEANLFCIGTALVNSKQKAIGALSLSTNRMDEATRQKLSRNLLSQTQRLDYLLSYSIK